MFVSRVGCQFRLEPCSDVGGAIGTAGFTLERSLITASVLATTVGLALAAGLTGGTSGQGPTTAGAFVYMVGGLLIVIWELARIGGADLPYAMVVGYVVLAFVGQGLLGWGLVRADPRLRKVGWATVVWNFGLLVALSVASPADMYFPVAHNVMLAAIAIAILFRERPFEDSHVS